MIVDAGLTVAESPRTLELQRDQLIRGLRDAMLYPSLATGAHEVPAVPDGMAAVETPDGVFHFNPARTGADEIVAAASIGRLNTFLGLGPYSKDDIHDRVAAGELPIAVAEIAPDGTEVKAAWGTTVTAPEQFKALDASKTPGHFVIVTSPLHILAARASSATTPE